MVRDTAFMYNCHSLQGQRYCIQVEVSCSTRSEMLQSCTNAMSCKVRDVAVMYKCHVLQGQRGCSHVQLSLSVSPQLQRQNEVKVPGDVTYSMSPCPPAPFLINTVTQTPLQRQISMKIYQEMHSNFDLQNPQEIRREVMPLKKGHFYYY